MHSKLLLNTRLLVGSAFICLVAASAPASAQTAPAAQEPEPAFSPLGPETEGFSVTPFLGAGFAGDFENSPAEFGVALGYGANERISLEAELGIGPNGSQGDVIAFDTSVWTLSGNVLYHFAQPDFTPYVTAGVGVMGADNDIDDLFPDVDADTTAFAWNLGGGLKTALNDRIGLRADLRYFNARDVAPDHWRAYGGVMIRGIGR